MTLLTADERRMLKLAVDQAKRERLRAARAGVDGCKGCGGDLDGRTAGCNTCSNRAAGKRKREDPAYRDRDRARHRQRRDAAKSDQRPAGTAA